MCFLWVTNWMFTHYYKEPHSLKGLIQCETFSISCKQILHWRVSWYMFFPYLKFRAHYSNIHIMKQLSCLIQCYIIPRLDSKTVNVEVEWGTSLLRIRDVPVSKLGPRTGYPKRFFMFYILQQMQYLKWGHNRFLPRPFHPSPCHSMPRSLNYRKSR
jgi:hypothetical protein